MLVSHLEKAGIMAMQGEACESFSSVILHQGHPLILQLAKFELYLLKVIKKIDVWENEKRTGFELYFQGILSF